MPQHNVQSWDHFKLLEQQVHVRLGRCKNQDIRLWGDVLEIVQDFSALVVNGLHVLLHVFREWQGIVLVLEERERHAHHVHHHHCGSG